MNSGHCINQITPTRKKLYWYTSGCDVPHVHLSCIAAHITARCLYILSIVVMICLEKFSAFLQDKDHRVTPSSGHLRQTTTILQRTTDFWNPKTWPITCIISESVMPCEVKLFWWQQLLSAAHVGFYGGNHMTSHCKGQSLKRLYVANVISI